MPRRIRTGAASPVWQRWVVVALVLGVLVGCGGQGRTVALPGTTLPGANASSQRPLPDPGPTTPDVEGPAYTTRRVPQTTPPEASASSERPLPDPGPTTPEVEAPPVTAPPSPLPPDTNLYRVQVSVEGTETPGVVTSDVGGISCPGTCFSRYPRGAPVTLTAQTEADGQVFTGWGGACSSAQGSTCTLSVDESLDVTARYAPAGP
jgi:hypothetical protein